MGCNFDSQPVGTGFKLTAFRRVVASKWCFKINPAEEYRRSRGKSGKAGQLGGCGSNMGMCNMVLN